MGLWESESNLEGVVRARIALPGTSPTSWCSILGAFMFTLLALWPFSSFLMTAPFSCCLSFDLLSSFAAEWIQPFIFTLFQFSLWLQSRKRTFMVDVGIS